MIRTSKFPDAHEQACLSKIDFNNEDAEAISNWIANPRDILLFMGNPGCGKSYFSMCVKNLLEEQKKKYVYVEEKDLFSGLKQTMRETGDFSYDLEVYGELPFLILDDMGSSKMTEWNVNDVLFSLIDNRVKSRLPTLISSNVMKNELKTSFGERIESRLMAKRNLIIQMKDQDLRKVYT